MANELPYFKFKPADWDNGNIQLCSRQSKGLFADLCSTYWVRQGELPYALALQKQCNGDATLMQELIDNEIIIINDGQIIIEFLDEQLAEFVEIGKKRADAANKRWNASAMQKQCKSNAIREEKRREEKKKEFIPPTLEEVKEYFEECGYTEASAIKAFRWYDELSWIDSKGKAVINWKGKMQKVWFTPENQKQSVEMMP